jgi:tRNA(Ile)-lysidine synthase
LWRELHPSLKRATVREAVRRLRRALRNINFEHVEKAVDLACEGATGAQATLPQGLMLTVGYDTLMVADEKYRSLPDLPLLSAQEPLPVALPGRTRLPSGSWILTTEILPRAAVVDRLTPEGLPAILDRRSWQAYLDADVVGSGPVLRPRRTGDRFLPLGMNGRSKRVNELMINEKIPADWRDHIPLLVSDEGEILWVCGWRPDHRARVSKSTQHMVWLRFERETELE